MIVNLNKYVDSGAGSKVIAFKQLDTSRLDKLYLVARSGPYKLRSDPPIVVTINQSRVNDLWSGSLTVKAVVVLWGHSQVDWGDSVYKLFTSVRLYQGDQLVAACRLSGYWLGYRDSYRLNVTINWGPDLEPSDLEFPSGGRRLSDEQIAELMDGRTEA